MTSIVIPSSEADRKRIADAMKEISNSMTRIDSEKDFQKEALNDLSEEVGISKKYLAKMARIYHKQNLSEVTGEMEDIQELYETILG